MKLPMRFRILHLIAQHECLSESEIIETLKSEYGNEGQFKKSIINTHLQSMRAVGLIEMLDPFIDQNGELEHRFKITEYGIDRLKYLPKGWKTA